MPLSSVREGIQYALKFNTAADFKLKSYFHSEHGDLFLQRWLCLLNTNLALVISFIFLSFSSVRQRLHHHFTVSHNEPVLCCGYSKEFRQVVSCTEGSVSKLLLCNMCPLKHITHHHIRYSENQVFNKPELLLVLGCESLGFWHWVSTFWVWWLSRTVFYHLFDIWFQREKVWYNI